MRANGNQNTAIKEGRTRNIRKVGQALTQALEIIEFIKANGSITTIQAFGLGITRLASRVYELRAHGINVVKEMITVENRHGKTCRVARYYIPGGVPECFTA